MRTKVLANLDKASFADQLGDLVDQLLVVLSVLPRGGQVEQSRRESVESEVEVERVKIPSDRTCA